ARMFPSADARGDLQRLRLGEATLEPQREIALLPEQRIAGQARLSPELEDDVAFRHPDALPSVDPHGLDAVADLRQLRQDRASRLELAQPDPAAIEDDQLAGGPVDPDVVTAAESRQERLEAQVAPGARERRRLPEEERAGADGRPLCDPDHGHALQAQEAEARPARVGHR